MHRLGGRNATKATFLITIDTASRGKAASACGSVVCNCYNLLVCVGLTLLVAVMMMLAQPIAAGQAASKAAELAAVAHQSLL